MDVYSAEKADVFKLWNQTIPDTANKLQKTIVALKTCIPWDN